MIYIWIQSKRPVTVRYAGVHLIHVLGAFVTITETSYLLYLITLTPTPASSSKIQMLFLINVYKSHEFPALNESFSASQFV